MLSSQGELGPLPHGDAAQEETVEAVAPLEGALGLHRLAPLELKRGATRRVDGVPARVGGAHVPRCRGANSERQNQVVQIESTVILSTNQSFGIYTRRMLSS